MSSEAAPLRYMVNGELRDRLVSLAGITTERYGAGSDLGLEKQHVAKIAAALGVAPDEDVDLTLEEYYRRVCDAAGVEYNETAGNQWGLGRRQLKAIIRAMEHEEVA